MEDSEALPPHPAADVTEHVGYRLKRAAAALRARMDQALRDHDLTVPQYSCLELLDERPGISGAELARGTFVTRQSSAIVVRGLEQAGLITRPATAEHGRDSAPRARPSIPSKPRWSPRSRPRDCARC